MTQFVQPKNRLIENLSPFLDGNRKKKFFLPFFINKLLLYQIV